MGMQRTSTWVRPLTDPLAHAVSQEFDHRIVALHMGARISRRVVEQRTRIDWKKIQRLEEGWAMASLADVVRSPICTVSVGPPQAWLLPTRAGISPSISSTRKLGLGFDVYFP